MRMSIVAAFLLGLTLLGAPAESQPAAERHSDRPDLAAVETIRGEVVVRSDEVELVIAIDEADAEGSLDGKVDQLFYMPVIDLLTSRLALRDPLAEVQVRRFSVRALLPTTGKDLSFHLADTREVLPEALDLGMVLERKRYREGLHLLRYQGEKVSELTLKDVERIGPAVMKTVLPPVDFDIEQLGIDPLKPTPEPGEGGSTCSSSCSISCGTGSCAASCNPGHCAQCKCFSQAPTCYCV